MSRVSDWQDIGVFPLQDHEEGVPLELRQQIVGGRIVKMPKAGSEDTNQFTQYGKEGAQGTLGDIHPWMLWQTTSRQKRAMGSWAQSFAGIIGDGRAAGGGPTTGGGGQTEVGPVANNRWQADLRYVGKTPAWPTGFPRIPLGVLVGVFPAMDEKRQQEVMIHGDPRLFAPAVDGPGTAGTLVCDLQPFMEPCMDGSAQPGVGGRHARLQSMLRVIAMPVSGPAGLVTTTGNGLAWNMSHSQQEKLAGLGMVWIKAERGVAGPITGGGSSQGPAGGVSGPITGGGSTSSSLLDDDPSPETDQGGPFGQGYPGDTETPGGRADGEGDDWGKEPNRYGRFIPRPAGDHVVALMAKVDGWGPITGGAVGDKHRLGVDRDGNPINSAHISTKAFIYDDADRDGPFLFEGKYPTPGSYPLKSKVHLTWDKDLQHPFADGPRSGMWRWWAEVPTVAPTQGPPIPTVITPGGGPGPGGPGPGGPGNPGPPGPVPPTTGGPRGPTGPAPPGPGVPGGNTGGPPPGGGPGGPGGPITPNPPGPWPGGRRFPGYPLTGGPLPYNPRPGDPLRGGQYGAGRPGGPGAPGVPIPVTGGGSSSRQAQGNGYYPPPRAGGLFDVAEMPWDDGSEPPPGVNQHVGTSSNQTNLYVIHHPLMESFAGMAFRPQLWVAGYPNFVHDPTLPAGIIEADERERPQCLQIMSWGAIDVAQGDWNYTVRPAQSRARGGTCSGGILIAPPEYEMEDYLGVGSNTSTATAATSSYLCLAPGTCQAFGTPNIDGGLNAGSAVIVALNDTNKTLQFKQLNSSRAAQDTLNISMVPGTNAVTVTTPGTLVANTRVSSPVVDSDSFESGGSPGLTASFTFYDNDVAKHDVTITGGIITGWTITP